MSDLYAPIMPTRGLDGPPIFTCDNLREQASNLYGYHKVKLDIRSALELARMSPYPDGVKVAMMKQVANYSEITLEQARILLGWAARKSQASSRA